jgi:hypothetical protein
MAEQKQHRPASPAAAAEAKEGRQVTGVAAPEQHAAQVETRRKSSSSPTASGIGIVPANSANFRSQTGRISMARKPSIKTRPAPNMNGLFVQAAELRQIANGCPRR